MVPLPEPSLNSSIKYPPDIRGLTPDCARTVWYSLAVFPQPETYTEGNFTATFKTTTNREAGKQLIYSPEVKGTFFKEKEDTNWDSMFPSYEGHWNLTQLCYLAHRPEVQVAASISMIVADICPDFSRRIWFASRWIGLVALGLKTVNFCKFFRLPHLNPNTYLNLEACYFEL
jgi:hypothetical protein